ncbi:MAG: glutamate--tRNA ligase [Candidatus Sumerlaeota bacterium]|nr:glutamate--tRNA ligase [Candidatus Sumerlaeota bacterium]
MSSIRVRIAPSPTGDLHVGTAYISLFNYCFAKKHGGQFILRIEDTDQARSRRQYEERIYQGLRWLGVKYDEGPDVGGPCGPYRQSERSAIYQEHCRMLAEKGHVYPCFCTPETLEKIRHEQRLRKEPPGYDGRCRRLDPEHARQRIAAGEPHVWRLAVPDQGDCEIKDALFGDIKYDYKQIDDQVLLKSDGLPTYHLANVVDDHLMGITHVIRGEDWMPSTPKHIYLYQCFGWTPPVWTHIPLLLNPDRTKMSKRKNPTSVFYYRDAGFLPEAMLNYLAMIGYSRPNMTDEMFSLDEMISDFDIKNISLGGSVFDTQKLTWLNGRYLREKHTPAALLERFKQWRFNDDFLGQIMPLVHERIETLGDMMSQCKFFWQRQVEVDTQDIIPKGRAPEDVTNALQCLLWEFEDKDDWSPAGVEAAIKEVAAFMDWKMRDATGILFRAVMGSKVGTPLYESMSILGKDLSRERMRRVIELLGAPGRKKLEELEKRYKSRAKTPPAQAQSQSQELAQAPAIPAEKQ